LKGNILAFVKLFQFTKKEGMTPQRVINALKTAEEVQCLEAERRRIADIIDEDGPKILELNRLKVSSANGLTSILEEVESAREYRNNQLKSIQGELDLAKEHAINELKLEQEKLDKQKASLASEVDKYKEYTINEINKCKECLVGVDYAKNQLKFIQNEVDQLKQEEQQLTSRIERLKNEERHEQYIRRLQSQPQLRQQSVFIALVQAAQQALVNDELHTHRPLSMTVQS
jgi:hypothetical protein